MQRCTALSVVAGRSFPCIPPGSSVLLRDELCESHLNCQLLYRYHATVPEAFTLGPPKEGYRINCEL